MSGFPDGGFLDTLTPQAASATYAPKNIPLIDVGAPSGTDDTAAVDAAVTAAKAAGTGIQFRAGTYHYNGTGTAWAYPHVRGAGAAQTSITLGAGLSFITSPAGPAAVGSIDVEGVTFDGGFGAIRLTYTGAETASGFRKNLRDVYCTNYTGCAVSSLASDEPFWNIEQSCRFFGLPGSMGVALAGLVDDANIRGTYAGHRVDIKLGQGGNNARISGVRVRLNITDPFPRATVWVVPQTSSTNDGAGLLVSGFKFGGENQLTTDYDVLYADEDTGTGTDFATHPPLLSAASTGYIGGHTVTDCMVGGAAARPVIYSTTPNVDGCRFGPLTIAGTAPTYLVQFLPAAIPAASTNSGTGPTSTNNILGPLLFDNPAASVTVPWSNAVGIGATIDPTGEQAPANWPAPATWPAPASSGLTTLLATGIRAFTFLGGAAGANVSDALGGSDASEVTIPQYGLAKTPLAAVTVGEPMWIEFDLKASALTPLAGVLVQIQNDDGTGMQFERYYPLPTTWQRYRALFVPRSAAKTLNVGFASLAAGTGKVDVGRVRVYHATEPALSDVVLPTAITGTTAPAAGAAAALPATPAGYLTVYIAGVARQIAYY